MKTISFLFPQYSLRYLEAIWIIYFLFCYFLLVFFSLSFLCRCLILFLFFLFLLLSALTNNIIKSACGNFFSLNFSFSVSTQIYNCRIVDNITMVIPFLLIALMMLIQFVIAWKLSSKTIIIKIMFFHGMSEDVGANDERSETYCL